MTPSQTCKATLGWLQFNSPGGRNKLRGARLILMLHRVLADDNAAALPHRAELCIGQLAFARLLAWLRQHFVCVPLEDLLTAPSDGLTRIALTFDDGWRDNAEVAYPLLAHYRVPASIFLSTDFIGNPRGFWWESIGETLWCSAGAPARSLLLQRLAECGAPPLPANFDSLPERRRSRALAIYLQSLKALPATTLQHLANACPQEALHAMNWEQVAELERSGWVRFGPHGAGHGILTKLDDAALTDDLQRSHLALATHCQTPLPIYCYPNGDHDSRVRQAVAQLGYRRALGTHPGLYRDGDDPLALARIGVSHPMARHPGLFAWRLMRSLAQ
ncbi:polysaccharide deacetylase [Stutzerimonas stutzeri]|uniref:Polysaccharide deacetylase n=1 Tax=Stutzerimonas stutzeri TaxID=316 RepID=W8R433_STUST|nr:polysaccharide deacetylase family protein [Stutzerimonas stutzeri]AHL77384.1 polysaccharide deacetylase [Stutzerimonas stutzeri]MCQ4330279.1 polysaccharide deacetylase family protein [Stutzerimonas stutzeri]